MPNTRRAPIWVALAFAAALVFAGCNMLSAPSAAGLGSARNGSDKASSTAETELQLAGAEWVISPEPAGTPDSAAAHRHWRHAGLDAVLTDDNAGAHLRGALRSANAAVAATAAVGLARLGETRALPQLEQTARNSSLKLSLRGAAIEAIGELQVREADEILAHLAEEVGRFQGPASARYVADLHADLVRAMARCAPERHADAIQNALGSPSPAVRLEATLAYTTGTRRPVRQLADRAGDDVAKVRAAAIEALAATGHPDAQAVALRAVNDYSLHVRLAAIRALGKLPAAENDAKLNELAENTSDVIRTAAVRALVDRGDLRALARAALDPSWRVRSAAAEELLRLPYAERSKLAQALVADASLSVQQRMLESLAEWPLPEAIPALLAALEGRTSATRRGAAEQLQERWPAAFELSPVAAADTLSAEAVRLREVWRREYAGELPGDSPSTSMPASNSAEAIVRAEAAVAELAGETLAERRAAARELAREHAQVQLPDASLARLRMLVEEETDELVWNDLLVFLEHDGRAAAADLAAIAATHPTGEVRRRACAYFGKHPGPRSAEVLLNSLADSDVTVVREAIRGLGHQPAIDDLSPLRAVLTSADNSLSLAAAVSLARLGSDEGLHALLRLIQHQDPALRRQAVSALGDVLDEANGQQRFTDQQRREAAAELVRLLENEHQGDVRRTAEASLQAIGSSDR